MDDDETINAVDIMDYRAMRVNMMFRTLDSYHRHLTIAALISTYKLDMDKIAEHLEDIEA